MNYLGHLLVLPDEGLITLGNLLGDFFKGRVNTIEPAELRIGVTLHREIDSYTDQHEVVQRSIARISAQRRRVAGVLVDVFYDHFFAEGVDMDGMRHRLLDHAGQLPEPLRSLPGRMISEGWMGQYTDVAAIAVILRRMEERRKRVTGLAGGEVELIANYNALREDALRFYPDVLRFTKEALHRLRSASRAELQSGVATGSASDLPQSG